MRQKQARVEGAMFLPEAVSVADVMRTVVVTVVPPTPVGEVVRITDAEILRRIDRSGRSLLDRLMRRTAVEPSGTAGTAGELMVSPVATVPRDMPTAAAIRVMLAAEHKLLPVVDDEGRLCGMVGRTDALRAVIAAARDEGGSECG